MNKNDASVRIGGNVNNSNIRGGKISIHQNVVYTKNDKSVSTDKDVSNSSKVEDKIIKVCEDRNMKVFMSHSSLDKIFVERLATDLRTRASIDAWLDKWEILPGERIPQKLEEGLSDAGIFVLVLSPNSFNSQWVSYEKDAWLTAQIDEEVCARRESRTPNRRLIPVLYQNCEKPFFLKSFLHVSIDDENYEKGFQELIRGIRGESIKPPLGSSSISTPVKSLPISNFSAGVAPRKLALNLLKSLLHSQFEEVIFNYEVDEAHLRTGVTQAQKATDVIKYAAQKEGDSLSELLNEIYSVVPHLHNNSNSK